MQTRPLAVLFAGGDLSSTRPVRIELRRRGAIVRRVDSVDDALRLAVDEAPDVVVVDEDLDRDSASPTVERLSELRPDVDLILLENGLGKTPHGVGLGLIFSAIKPVSNVTLLDAIVSAYPDRLATEAATPRKSPRIVCVDDEPAILRSLARTLSRRGYEVVACENSGAALDELRRVRADAAIVDVMMPGIDGFELSREIDRVSGGRVPVVILSALESDRARREGLHHGARYYLTKPFEPSRLLDVVDLITGNVDEPERRLLEAKL